MNSDKVDKTEQELKGSHRGNYIYKKMYAKYGIKHIGKEI